jgi:hypothetical protein
LKTELEEHFNDMSRIPYMEPGHGENYMLEKDEMSLRFENMK